jgi:hypothetical protein
MSNNLISYELHQRKRTLTSVLWIALFASLALGLLNLQFRTVWSVIALFAMALFCIPLLVLNSRGHLVLAAAFFCIIVLLVITVNLFDGDGVHDSGILAYPIFILLGTLFFGKRSLPIFSLAAIGSLAAIVYLEIHGYVHPTISTIEFDILLPIVILFMIASAVTWVIVGNVEKSLERVEQSDAELRNTYALTLEAWARVLEYRDRETQGHSRRLIELSTRLGQALGLSQEDIAHLQRGALLHDIGKLAIPDYILLKPAALDESEREIIQKHPWYAKQMLSEISYLQPAIPIVYSHHERWDGQGYPDGLKGDEIPLLARIFAIVDTWDALNSERPYRRAWSTEEAIAHIKENAGTKFDPHIVEVFLQTTSNANVK